MRARALMIGTNDCRILSHRSDCTIAENANEYEYEEASKNAALEKKDRLSGSLTLEHKTKLIGKTPSEYKEICASIVPYVPHTRDIKVINITPSRDFFANDVNTVIDAGDALTTATNGGGGKTCLMVGVAVELRKRGKKVLFTVPMHKHKDTIIAKGKVFNTEFKHKTDVYLYADFMNKIYFVIFKMFTGVDVVIMEEVAQTNTDYILLITMLKRHLKFTVLASGDNNQCDSVLEKGQVYVDIFNNKYFR